MYFTDVFNGWVASSTGIRNTTDGGFTWNLQSSSNVNSIFFLNQDFGWACGENGLIIATTNGGLNWVSQISGGTGSLRAIQFVNQNIGWASESSGQLRKTTNGGSNWILAAFGIAGNISSLFFTNENTGWIAGGTGVISKSTNGGVSWIPQNSGIISDLNSIYFPNSSTGWAVGAAGKILWTSNGGSNWFSQNGYTGKYLTSVKFVNHATGWIVGDEGTIIKTIDGGGTVGINTISTEVPSGFSLNQNYPNPFNPVTVIRYAVPKYSFISLKIFDVMGREVALLVNENQQAGTYEYSFNINEHTNIPSGVLFYRLQSEYNSLTKKMILLK